MTSAGPATRILLTAPYLGEIGWELMSWQARVRWMLRRGGYDRVVVLGAAGRAAFYADMPLEYRVVDLSGAPGTAYEDRRFDLKRCEIVPSDDLKQFVARDVNHIASEYRTRTAVDVMWPAYDGRLYPC